MTKATEQRQLKGIAPCEEIAVNVVKKVTGKELGNVLGGIEGFTKCFNPDDEYMVEIKVQKSLNQA